MWKECWRIKWNFTINSFLKRTEPSWQLSCLPGYIQLFKMINISNTIIKYLNIWKRIINNYFKNVSMISCSFTIFNYLCYISKYMTRYSDILSCCNMIWKQLHIILLLLRCWQALLFITNYLPFVRHNPLKYESSASLHLDVEKILHYMTPSKNTKFRSFWKIVTKHFFVLSVANNSKLKLLYWMYCLLSLETPVYRYVLPFHSNTT